MLRIIKKLGWVALLALSPQFGWAFSPEGPIGNDPKHQQGSTSAGDSWQAPSIGYGLGGDVGAPKNIGEEYRRNTPVLYYTYDVNFLDSFGSNGVVAIDGAISIMNGLTNVSQYSADLSEFPDDTSDINLTAQAVGLTDLKSMTLGLLMEQMGLTDPIRYVWTLHDRNPGPACPLTAAYGVVQRNLGIVNSSVNQVQYTAYINDQLYSYHIDEFCNPPGPPDAVTVPFNVEDPGLVAMPIAAFEQRLFEPGLFFQGLTRDDVAGLRYLLNTNNVNMESPAAGSFLEFTNLVPTNAVITSSNLNLLKVFALTNDPALLVPTFGVSATLVSNNFTVVAQPNIVSYFTNKVGAPAGSAPQFVITTNGLTYIPLELFYITFNNVLTNGNLTNTPNVVLANNQIRLNYSPNTAAQLVTTYLTNQPGAPFGSPPITNTTVKYITITNMPSGEYLTIPPTQCGWKILGVLATNVTVFSNLVTAATNTDGFVGTQYQVTRFTNHIFQVQVITCSNLPPAQAIGLYQGIERVQFVRADFDSLISGFFHPVTNTYTMTMVTNSQLITRRFHRIAVVPDFLMSAADLDANVERTDPNYNQANAYTNLAGPGTIDPLVGTSTQFTFDKNGPFFVDFFSPFLSQLPFRGGGETNQLLALEWGSFDGTTNLPVVYPNGTDIQNIVNQILIHISPTSLPDGTNAVPYPAQTFTTTGGAAFSPPFIWAATGLPSGISMASDGTLSGEPTQSGTFDVVVTMTDSLGRSVQWDYVLIIH